MTEGDRIRAIIEGAVESAFILFPDAGDGTAWPKSYKDVTSEVNDARGAPVAQSRSVTCTIQVPPSPDADSPDCAMAVRLDVTISVPARASAIAMATLPQGFEYFQLIGFLPPTITSAQQ